MTDSLILLALVAVVLIVVAAVRHLRKHDAQDESSSTPIDYANLGNPRGDSSGPFENGRPTAADPDHKV